MGERCISSPARSGAEHRSQTHLDAFRLQALKTHVVANIFPNISGEGFNTYPLKYGPIFKYDDSVYSQYVYSYYFATLGPENAEQVKAIHVK